MSTMNFHELLRYEPDTGKLFWLPRGLKKWDVRWAGQEVGTISSNGYVQVRVNSKLYLAHRLAWFLAHGEWPQEIDHINGDKQDNRLVNLRSCTATENRRNMPIRKNKTSQYSGVRRYKNTNRWCVLVNSKYEGLFDDEHEAGAYAKRLYAELGFHPNHGRATGVTS